MLLPTKKATIGLVLTSVVNASPFPSLLQRQATPSVTTVEMTFVGGPASYLMTFPADGSTHEVPPADSSLSISQIFATGGLDIHSYCSFEFAEAEGVQVVITPNAYGGVDVGPPGPVKSVTCLSGNGQGTCLAENGKTRSKIFRGGGFVADLIRTLVDCTTSSSSTGFQYTGTCCAGLICAANKCRSTKPQPPQPTCGTLYGKLIILDRLFVGITADTFLDSRLRILQHQFQLVYRILLRRLLLRSDQVPLYVSLRHDLWDSSCA